MRVIEKWLLLLHTAPPQRRIPMPRFAKNSKVYTWYPNFHREMECVVEYCETGQNCQTGVMVKVDKIKHAIDSWWFHREPEKKHRS